MRYLPLVLLLVSVSASANPFKHFVGTYDRVNAPQITSSGPYECRWALFNDMVSVRIQRVEGVYLGDVLSTWGSTLNATTTRFENFNYPWWPDSQDSGEVSGDATSARYMMKSTNDDYAMTLVWTITTQGETHHLKVTIDRTEGDPAVPGSCVYEVDLFKR